MINNGNYNQIFNKNKWNNNNNNNKYNNNSNSNKINNIQKKINPKIITLIKMIIYNKE